MQKCSRDEQQASEAEWGKCNASVKKLRKKSFFENLKYFSCKFKTRLIKELF